MGIEEITLASKKLEERYEFSGDNCPLTDLEYIQGKDGIKRSLYVNFADGHTIELTEREGNLGIEDAMYIMSCEMGYPEGYLTNKLRDLGMTSLSLIEENLSSEAKEFWGRCAKEFDFSD
ncbi:hypothetical protein CL617_00095 [archaeon]|nr:hypothetical protein [archaeon]|tara:strand:+ start:1654 stop:2013 length:360 start_codon:yes stop_codon:yes gene_type:complete